ncbi:MAG TPA: adenosylcobinamide-phosphate synthase CbiB [Dehalococcoidia bacterium]
MTFSRGKPEVLLAAVLLDLVGGDPPDRFHPVSWFGRGARWWEGLVANSKTGRLVHGSIGAVLLPGLHVAASAAPIRRVKGLRRILLEAALLKTTFAVRGLITAGDEVARRLEADDLVGAREALSSLVSRDAASLGRRLVASAVIESLAENVVDSFLAPWLYYAVAGIEGATAYRALNTLDSMWGYRDEEYEQLGKAAARLDDAASYLPATVGARLVIIAGGLLGLAADEGRRLLARDGASTASPNAGRLMSAMAGVVGVQLEKPGAYVVGDPIRALDGDRIQDAQRVVAATAALGLALALGLTVLLGRRR